MELAFSRGNFSGIMKSNLFPRRTKDVQCYLFEVKEDLELKSASYSKKEKVQLFPLKQNGGVFVFLGPIPISSFQTNKNSPS